MILVDQTNRGLNLHHRRNNQNQNRHQLQQNEDSAEEGYDTTNEDYDSQEDSDHLEVIEEHNREGFLPSGLNNYLNNLNLNFNLNLNGRLNAFETSLWKLYENTQFPPASVKTAGTLAIANLWKQISDEESEAKLKRLEFQEVQQKAAAEVRRRLGPKIKSKIQTSENAANINQVENLKTEGDAYHCDPSVTFDIERNNRSASATGDSNVLIDEGEGDGVLTLDQEFWSQFFGFKTETEEVFEVSGSAGLPSSTTTDLQSQQPKPPVNAFYSRLHLTLYDKIKSAIMTIFLPIRALGILLFLCLACLFSVIGTIGLTLEETNAAPLSKWRRAVRWITANILMRTMFFFSGFHWVKRIGKQASPKEAPVLVIGPHSTYFDAFVVILLGAPSVVAKESAKYIPFFGRLINFTQPIYVNREDPASRQNSVQEIIQRAKSDEDWPQVYIYPEGTCTNRSVLAQFKPGAFIAGVPVQPVLIRYPNRLDTVTWTFDSPSVYQTIYLSLTQIHNSITIEYLPVYFPNDEEKQNAKLYAENIQRLMGEALGIPVSDFSFEDGMVLTKLSQTQIRHKLETIWRIKGALNLRESPTETTLVYEGTTTQKFAWKVALPRFQEIFQIPSKDTNSSPEVEGLFNLFKQDDSSVIDLRAYLLLVCFMYSDAKLDLLMTLMFKMYTGKKNVMAKQDFVEFMVNVLESEEKVANDLFNAGSNSNPSVITFDEFRRKITRRVEYVKLYAMEATGQRSGNYPKRNERDLESKSFKTKTY